MAEDPLVALVRAGLLLDLGMVSEAFDRVEKLAGEPEWPQSLRSVLVGGLARLRSAARLEVEALDLEEKSERSQADERWQAAEQEADRALGDAAPLRVEYRNAELEGSFDPWARLVESFKTRLRRTRARVRGA